MTRDVRFRNALLLLDQGRTDDAVVILRTLVESNRKNALGVQSRVALGQIMADRGDHDAARRLMTDAIMAADGLGGSKLNSELDIAMDVLAELP